MIELFTIEFSVQWINFFVESSYESTYNSTSWTRRMAKEEEVVSPQPGRDRVGSRSATVDSDGWGPTLPKGRVYLHENSKMKQLKGISHFYFYTLRRWP